MRIIPLFALLLAVSSSSLFNNSGNNNNAPLLVSAIPSGKEPWKHHVQRINIENITKSKRNDGPSTDELRKIKRQTSLTSRRSLQERAPPGNGNRGNGNNNSPNANKDSNSGNNNNNNNENTTNSLNSVNTIAASSGNSSPVPTNSAQSSGIVSGQAVPTGSLSTTAIALIGIVSVLFVSLIGVFVCVRRKKSREQTKEIIIKSATAFEQQSTSYEKLDEPEAPRPLGRYTAVAMYAPALDDELDIQPGDKVTLLVEYDDGWVQGINETRGGVKGVFPGWCIDKNNNGPALMMGKRSSSMNYGYQTINLR